MRKQISLVTVAAMLLSLLSGMPAPASYAADAAVYVDAERGSDANAGTEAAPVKTLAKARDLVRTMNDDMTSDLYVYLRGGDYGFDATVVFDERDSGTNGFDVVYASYPGEKAVLHAGERVTGWEPYEGEIYKANVGANWTFETLTEDGEMLTKARHPNTGYSRVHKYSSASPRSSFYFRDGDIPPIANLAGLEIFAIPGGPTGEWSWASSITDIVSVNRETKFVQLGNTVAYEMGIGSRYYVMGSLELLDAPGEFYLDKQAGVLYYWPLELPIEAQTIVAPKMRKLIELKGSSPDSRVANITFQDLTFTGGDRRTRDDAYDQALVTMTNSAGISILDNVFENTGATGVSAVDWAEYIRISGNVFRNIGTSGVQLVSGNYKTLQYKNKFNVVSNNHIHDIGLLSAGSPGIALANSGDNEIVHNLIHDGPRSAIALGGFATNGSNGAIATGEVVDGVRVTLENRHDFKHTRNNLVAYNDVFALNQNTQDTGLIYIWGGGLNNRFANNYVHDSNIEFSFGHGIYSDDDTDGTIIENNVLYRLQYEKTEGKLGNAIFARGVGTKIKNNVIADNDITDAVFGSQPGGAPREQFEIERNVVLNRGTSGKYVYSFSDWTDAAVKSASNNLYFNESGEYMVNGVPPGNMPLLDWQQLQNNKFDQSTIHEDPLLRNAVKEDFRFRYQSPAYGLGIENVDLSNVGLTSDFKYAVPGDPLGSVFVKGEQGEVAAVELTEGASSALQVAARTEKGFVLDLSGAQVSFQSSNESVATVDADGVVTAVGSGLAVVTASVTAGGATESSDIDVAVGDELTGLELSAVRTGLLVGQQVSLSAVGTTAFGGRLVPNVAYASSDESVATVDANGRVTAVGLGAATITASANGADAAIGISVSAAILNSIAFAAAVASPAAGTETALSATGKLTDGSDADLSNASIVYAVDNPSIASVSQDGVLSALTTGRVQVSVRVTLGGVTKIATRSIFVRESGSEPGGGYGGVPGWDVLMYGDAEGSASAQGDNFVLSTEGGRISGIADEIALLSQTAGAEHHRSTVTLQARIERIDSADPNAIVGITFRKNDTSYAKNALAGLNGKGELVLNTRNNASLPGTRTLDHASETLALPADLKLVKTGNTVTAYYGRQPEGYDTELGTAEVEFAGDFVLGLVALSPAGEAVTAEFSNVAVTISESDAAVESLSLDNDEYSLVVDDTHRTIVTARFDDGAIANVTTQATFATSNATVATVGADGKVRGVSRGVAEITASYRGKTAKAVVTVREAMPPEDTIVGIALDAASYALASGSTHRTRVTATFDHPSLEKYEAELAALSGGAIVSSNSDIPASGGGFADGYWAVGASATWTVEAPAGAQDLAIRYANAGGPRTVSLYANGAKVKQVELAKVADSWSQWSTKTESVTLLEGVNTIALAYDEGDTGNVNFDYIGLTRDATVLDVTEDASYATSNASVATVDETGLVTARFAGQADITVSYLGHSATAKVTVPGSDEGSGAPSDPPADGAVTVEPGKVTIESSVDENGTAAAAVSVQQLKDAMASETGNLVVAVKPAGGATRVEVSLPAQALIETMQGKKTAVQVDTGMGSVTISIDELARHLDEGSADVSLSVSKVDPATLPDNVRAAVGANAVLDLSLSVDGKAITDFAGRNNVEVTFPYELAPGQKPNQVVVYYIDNDGKLETVRNGKYDAATGTVTFRPKHFSMYAAAANAISFVDTSETAWATEAIESLAARGIVQGVGEGAFRPAREVTRAEFAHMLVGALDVGAVEIDESRFTDVTAGDWYAESVTVAETLGIVNGRPNGAFGADDAITREEMAVMIDRAAKLLAAALPTGPKKTFADERDMSAFAAEAIGRMQQAGLIQGMGDGSFAPKATATRAQTANIVYALFKLL
ncbi:S-layer homology domain-containing protein [Paenibacillus antri]|nr:S-layer homology domain-containing protein [Paenibacillus antri]